MEFRLRVLNDGDAVGAGEDLTIRVDPPTSLDGLVWTCRVIWSGAAAGSVAIHGASSFQAIRLALDHLEIELPASVRPRLIVEGGVPWPVSRRPEAVAPRGRN